LLENFRTSHLLVSGVFHEIVHLQIRSI